MTASLASGSEDAMFPATTRPATSAPPTRSAAPSPAPRPTPTATPKPTATVPIKGNGKVAQVVVPGQDSGGTGRVVTYAFEIEGGLPIDRTAAATLVGSTLRDSRGWQPVKHVRFVQVSPSQRARGVKPDITISLVSPDRTDRWCAPLKTEGLWSCANKDRAVINARRWVGGVQGFSAKPRSDYQSYVLNHEVGHELGHGHVGCPGEGKLAPVMMQQSMGLKGCRPNVWPATLRG
ncbi:DUF3152 domain-containing protein [Demetria terragena]|uniref:DUF3152 domain-containing protein n=1 Tax=Demetria terragena TaxID=63959 RepID=UPI0003630752|nr:DUF3152 domain-containing protein [Demetria terragena]